METSSSGAGVGRPERGLASSSEGGDLEDFVMVPSQWTMDAAEMRKHTRKTQ